MTDHPKVALTIRPAGGVVTVQAGGVEVARSSRAVELLEGSRPPVVYLPREDAAMAHLERSDLHTTCPFKGEASYYSIVTPAGRIENAVWSYETPIAGAEGIAGHLAFYPERTRISRA